ncbi:unnamed protein product [Bursaphelenchus okinawaensis]|uniref:ABC-2 type transporter transmembrane domain-containing protein n=1 Tax=Bursaphelenchus okinawaensis TaxID=465554 RepID=A0A811K6S8_9BILA|nr:unnamed protein product [Bursaphelenchus okinawaensis]CAG9092607.1 unnamed protein product [Bursaphelenchus okinawaensis]
MERGFETNIRRLQRTTFHEEDLSSTGYVISEHMSSPEFELNHKPSPIRINSGYSSDTSDIEYLPDLNMHYAETEIHPTEDLIKAQDEGLFQSLRHQSHYFSNVDLFQQQDLDFNYLKYAKAGDIPTAPITSPHLRIMNLCFDLDSRSTFDKIMLRSAELQRVVSHITFELFAGDMMALLYTSESEIETFTRVLSQTNCPQGRTLGIFELNGHKLKPKQFGERVAHIMADNINSKLTLVEHLHNYSKLVKPATSSFKTEDMIEQLIQDLALVPFKGQLVENLGRNEISRLKIASAMLLDTDILICENVLKDMDLYDLAFVINFIRDWAQKKKKIVIIALNPPTVEILYMFGKVALMTCGRIVYMGESGGMCDYFESIGYASPPFKNPCDYYVDLVTHDVLNNESAKESMIRIRTLTEVWGHKMGSLNSPKNSIISPKMHHSDVVTKTLLVYKCLWQKALNHPISVCWEVIVNLLLSLFVGWLFFQIPLDRRSGINDRQGFLCTVMLLIQYPLSLISTRSLLQDYSSVEKDLLLCKYSRHNYLTSKLLFDFPFIVVSSVAYSMPMYTLVNQNPSVESDLSSLFSFSTVILVNMLLFRYLAWVFVFVSDKLMYNVLLHCTFFMTIVTFSGFTVHPEDQFLAILQFYNPVKLLASDLLRLSFLGKSNTSRMLSVIFESASKNNTQLVIDCHKKKVLATKLKQIPIYTVTQCLKTSGAEAFLFSGFSLYSNDARNLALDRSIMTKKKKEIEMDDLIPTKPTANITSSMRAEKVPEQFENTKSAPKESPEKGKAKAPPKKKSPPLVKLTPKNEVIEFPVNIVNTISQSSGTISYDSFKELKPEILESLKGTAQKTPQTEPPPIYGVDVQIKGTDAIPSVDMIDDVTFNRSIRQDNPLPGFEPFPIQIDHQGKRENQFAKEIVAEVMRSYIESGRDRLELVVNFSPGNNYPVLNMTFQRK